MAHRRNISDVRSFRIDNDARNRAAIFQADICPMFAAVGRSINAIAPIRRIPIVRFAASNPNHIRIGWRNRDRANREHRLLVENRIERNAAVVRFENAAVTERDVKNERIARIDCYVRNAAAHDGRADGARFEILKKHISQLRRT